ncbi:hypothetical protein GP486_007169 [Trichoglossum hirsutum]|uniref:C2H2-type domain-containing protein n=1 Tax=Trichoglossum hirsutum TaxID=265104 RepID=A0A9P8IG81_9PEZI|nr:hypothetical protein GP486_007169 [Trichoglossum hirsutum]
MGDYEEFGHFFHDCIIDHDDNDGHTYTLSSRDDYFTCQAGSPKVRLTSYISPRDSEDAFSRSSKDVIGAGAYCLLPGRAGIPTDPTLLDKAELPSDFDSGFESGISLPQTQPSELLTLTPLRNRLTQLPVARDESVVALAIVAILMQDSELYHQCQTAVGREESATLFDMNIRVMLRAFAHNLEQEARLEDHMDTARVVNSYATYIANCFRRHFYDDKSYDDKFYDGKIYDGKCVCLWPGCKTKGYFGRAYDLQRYYEDHASLYKVDYTPEPHFQGKKLGYVLRRFFNEPGDLQKGDEPGALTSPSHLYVLKEFILNSKAFATLKKTFSDWIPPSSLGTGTGDNEEPRTSECSSPFIEPTSGEDNTCSELTWESDIDECDSIFGADSPSDPPKWDLTGSTMATIKRYYVEHIVRVVSDRLQKLWQLPAADESDSGSSTNAQNQGDNVPGSGSSPENKSRKRIHDQISGGGDDHNGSSDGEDGDSLPRFPFKNSPSEGPQLFLACPFFKRNPEKFRKCRLYHLKDPSRVKQHIKRCHKGPQCTNCWAEFKDERIHEGHVRQGECSRKPEKERAFVTHEQERRLGRRGRDWNTIFKIIFPNDPLPSSPYIDISVSEDVNLVREFFLAEAPTALDNAITQALPEELRAAYCEDIARRVKDANVEIFNTVLDKLRTIRQQDQTARSSPTRPFDPALGSSINDTSLQSKQKVPPSTQVLAAISSTSAPPPVTPQADEGTRSPPAPIIPSASAAIIPDAPPQLDNAAENESSGVDVSQILFEIQLGPVGPVDPGTWLNSGDFSNIDTAEKMLFDVDAPQRVRVCFTS